jgi:hypothetical protein
MFNEIKYSAGRKNLAIVTLLMILSMVSFSQNINGKLGTSGQFIIRDTTNTFLSVSQTTGDLSLNRNLVLPAITLGSQLGTIFKGANRFIHTFSPAGSSGNNTFVGNNSGNFTMNGTGSGSSLNTAVGSSTLSALTIGQQNSAFGSSSMNSNSSGSDNSAFGCFSLNTNSSGYQNCAFGIRSMNNNTSGLQNTAYGYYSLYSNQSGFQNTAVGHSSLLYNTGNYNTALGYNAGSTITTGANLTCIGIDAAPTTPTAIDQITLGNGFVSSLRCNVTNISSLSDKRDKKNIKDLSLGLDFISKLKPRQFNWDKREWYEDNVSDGSKMKEAPTAGFIAQELDEVQTTENAEWLNLVLKDNPEKWEATPGNLFPIMVKAIQELKAENDELKANSENLSAEIESLKSMNKKLAELEQKINELRSVKNTTYNESK